MMQETNKSKIDEVWKSLVAASRSAPNEPTPTSAGDLADRVLHLGARYARPQPPSSSDERFVSWAAAIALAASILITLVCWEDVAFAWSPRPAIWEVDLVEEPLP